MELLLVLAFVVGIWLLAGVVGRRLRGDGRQRRRRVFRCHDCRYLLKSFDDGVTCGVGGGKIFKNPVHIANCMDHESR